MKILVLAPDVPATSRMPGSPRLFNLCRELSRLHELFLVTYCSSHERYQSFLNDPTTSPVFTRVEVLPDPPAVRWWGQQWHRVHLAAHFETRYRHAGYYRSIRDRIRELCVQERIDLIHVDLLAMTQYVDPQMNIPAIVDLHDSMTLLCRRMLKAERGWRKRLSAYLGLIGAKRLEADAGEDIRPDHYEFHRRRTGYQRTFDQAEDAHHYQWGGYGVLCAGLHLAGGG